MTITGARQGNITAGNFTEASVGNVWQQGHEDECLIQAFEHKILLPRDSHSGQPAGQRVHQPLRVTKVMDKSSPLLYSALVNGERLPKVELKFYRTSAQGIMEHYFTMTLEDAILTNITAYMPNCQDPGMAHFTHLEDLEFSYRKLTKTHEIASTSESDDWRSASRD